MCLVEVSFKGAALAVLTVRVVCPSLENLGCVSSMMGSKESVFHMCAVDPVECPPACASLSFGVTMKRTDVGPLLLYATGT